MHNRVLSTVAATLLLIAGQVFGADIAKSPSSEVKLPPGVSENWWATVRKTLEKDMKEAVYGFTGKDDTWQGQNRAHSLALSVTDKGIMLRPQSGAWSWGLVLTGWGRDNGLTSLPHVTPLIKANHIEYDRGPLTEWYINDEKGLEQGFTLNTPPPGAGNLVLEFEITGSLKAALKDRNIVFIDNNTEQVRLGALFAYDANRKDLPSSFVLTGKKLLITVAAKNAAYPVTIDPLITTPLTLTAPSGSSYFGSSVASAGDVNGDGYSDVIVGAYDSNTAYAYYGGGGIGLSLIPQQKRVDTDVPIGPLGKSDKLASFRLSALGRTPYGRGKVKLQWEVRPLGTLFTGTPTGQSASWHDTGVTGYSFLEQVSSLTQNTHYHWRVRLLYNNVATPLQPYSRWLTPSWNGPEESDFRTNDPSTVINLLSFTAVPSSSKVSLAWRTGAEIDTIGFYLLKSLTKGSGYKAMSAFIPSEGGPAEGASYTYTDADVKPGTTYYYKLEDMDGHGKATLHGPVSARVTGSPLTLISPEGPFPTDPPAFEWQAQGVTQMRLQFSTDPAFKKHIMTIPRVIRDTGYTPTPAQWKAIGHFMGTSEALYWRVTGKDGKHESVASEALTFSRKRAVTGGAFL